jgi:CHAD domain-containing protein
MPIDLGRIRKSARGIRKFVERNPRWPSSDAVHELRTDIRHVETAFVTLELDSKRGVRSLLRDLEKTRRAAGKLRDMDVFTAQALGLDVRGEQDCIVRLLEHLGAERSKRARKLRVAIAKRRPRMLKALRRGLNRVEGVAASARRSDDSSAVRETTARSIQLSLQLSHPGRLSRSNLHPYRLKVKELRDVLRLSGRSADSAIIRKLGKVKDAIGDWHDWVVLTDMAGDVLDHGGSCALAKRLQETRDGKYQDALSLAHALVARDLRPRVFKATLAK